MHIEQPVLRVDDGMDGDTQRRSAASLHAWRVAVTQTHSDAGIADLVIDMSPATREMRLDRLCDFWGGDDFLSIATRMGSLTRGPPVPHRFSPKLENSLVASLVS